MRKALTYLRAREWDNLQSLWVLPTARRLYLVGALAALVIAALALVAALLFQFMTLGSANHVDVPDPAAVAVKAIDPASLDALFQGPQALRVEAIPLTRPVGEGTPVARLSAQTPWGIAADGGFVLVGGREMEWFKEAPDPERGGATVLAATKQLVDAVNALPPDAASSKEAEVRMIAKDTHGNVSQPVVLKFRVSFKQPEQADASGQATDDVQDLSSPKELERIEVALALLAGSAGSPEYFDAREVAHNEPVRCNAQDDSGFTPAYVAAYDRVRKSVTQSNVDTFYKGLCEAWDQKIAEANQEAERLGKERVAAEAQNAAAEMTTAARKGWAKTLRDIAIGFAVTAVMFFMIVALFLAFLAIEGHSNALRQALEALARERKDD